LVQNLGAWLQVLIDKSLDWALIVLTPYVTYVQLNWNMMVSGFKWGKIFSIFMPEKNDPADSKDFCENSRPTYPDFNK
jgi:hypothetical protein